MSDSKAIALRDLSFSYHGKAPTISIRNLSVERGDRVFLFGPSGSGKTTLLGLIGGILSPSAGSVEVLGTNIAKLTAGQRDSFRGSHIGFIFQMFNLIPYLTVEENMILPGLLNADRAKRLSARNLTATAHEFADRLGLSKYLKTQVTSLSVGQQQRVAAARAMIGSPEIVIADEPTSALDTDHRTSFIELLFEMSKANNTTLVFVSHDQSLKSLFSRNISLRELNEVAT